jgi:hypothetical protein
MNIRLARMIIWSLPVFLFGGLLWHYLAPSGERVVRYEVGEVSPFVQRLLPDDRVSAVTEREGDSYVTLLDEPVYFSVTPPAGNFETVALEIAFEPGGTPTFELGGLKDVAAQAFDFKPLANTLLEELDWTRHDLADGLAVFSRDPNSEAYRTFLETPPDRAVVATYRATFPTPFRMAAYAPLGARQKFDVSLRGSHELLTYVKGEDFQFRPMYTDINRTYGADEGFVRVYDENNNLMTEFVIRDDGNIYDNQEPSAKTFVDLEGLAWPEGVYRIVLTGTSDMVWRSFETSQRYLVLKNRVFLSDDVGYLPAPRATTLFTNAERVTLETQHKEGIQTVMVGGDRLVVEQVGPKYSLMVPGTGVVELKSPVGDVKITGEGKYAFSRQSFFDPDPLPVNAFTDLEDSAVEHVLATLAPVREVDGWRVATGEFETDTLAVENGAYKFTLSAPGIHDNLGQVSVHAINVTFKKSSASATDLMLELKHLIKLLLP